MRRIYNSIVLLASAAIFHASPLLAEVPQRGAPPASLNAWVGAVNARISEVMVEPNGLTGITTALFRRGEDGRATDIVLVRATPAEERAARLTLQRLGQLPPLPRGVNPRQRIKLQLLLDSGYGVSAFRKKRRDMMAAADVENRRFAQGKTTMVADLSTDR